MRQRLHPSLNVVGAAGLLSVVFSFAAIQTGQFDHATPPSLQLASLQASALADDLLQFAATTSSSTVIQESSATDAAVETTKQQPPLEEPARPAPQASPQSETARQYEGSPDHEARPQPRRPRQAGQRQFNMQSPQELIDCCIDVANDIDADLAQQLNARRAQNPEEFSQTLLSGHVGRSLLAMAQLKQRDPQLYRTKISEVTQELQINRVTAALQEALKSSDQRKVDELTERLRNMLQIQLALSIKARGEHLTRIEEELKALRAEIEHDAKNFREIVEARVKQRLEQPAMTDAASLLPPPQREPRQQRQQP